MDKAIEGADSVHRMKPGRKPKVAAVIESIVAEAYARVAERETSDMAQTYAMRVWSGQSVDVPPAERKERVFAALRGQNLSTDGIIFPT